MSYGEKFKYLKFEKNDKIENYEINNKINNKINFVENYLNFTEDLFVSNNKFKQINFAEVFYDSDNHINDDDILYLNYARKIIFKDSFNQSIDNIPDNIINIELGRDYNKPINKISKNLKYIKLPGINLLNIFKESNIENLIIFKGTYNYILSDINKMLPNNLKVLYIDNFNVNNNKTLRFNNLSKNLLKLYLSGSIHFTSRIIINNLSNKLNKIELNLCYSSINVEYLPNSIKLLKLNLKNYIKNLPSSIIEIDISKIKNKFLKLGSKIKIAKLNIFCKNINYRIKHNIEEVYIKGENSTVNIKLNNSITELLKIDAPNINIFSNNNIYYIKKIDIQGQNIFLSNTINCKKICIKYTKLNTKSNKIFFQNLSDNIQEINFQNNSIISNGINRLPYELDNIIYKDIEDNENNVLKNYNELKAHKNFMCNSERKNLYFPCNVETNNKLKKIIISDRIIELYANSNVISKCFEMYLKQKINKNMCLDSYRSHDKLKFDGYKETFNKNITNIINECDDNIMIMFGNLFDFVKISDRKNIKIVNVYNIDEFIKNIISILSVKRNNPISELNLLIGISGNCNNIPKEVSDYYRIFTDIEKIICEKLINIGCIKLDIYNFYKLKIF